MIVFTRVPEPSSLLLNRDLNRVARALLAQCAEDRFLQQPGVVDLLWQQAQGLEAQGEAEGSAIVSIRLAELFRGCNRLGPALKCVEKAKDILSKWPHKRQKQNLAVALYACGLVHQCLGSYQEAWACYEEALAVFVEARAQRESFAVTLDFEARCRRAESVIEELSTYVARAAIHGDRGGIQFCHLIDCWLAEEKLPEDNRPAVSVMVKEVVIGMELQLGSRNYRLEGLRDGPDLRLAPSPVKGYFLRKVHGNGAQAPDEDEAPPELRDAEYVLIEAGVQGGPWGDDTERAEGEGWVWREFVRDPETGDIFFVGGHQDEPLRPKFVGDDDLGPRRSGLVIGLFR
jgi:hypothetical protein